MQDKHCFHCGLPVTKDIDYQVTIDGVSQPMCCPGCQAVAQAIVDNDLTDYYRYRSHKNLTAQELVPEILQELSLYDKPALQKTFVTQTTENILEAALILEGITCAACVWLNEKHINSLTGVIEFRVNYSTHRARLRWNNDEIQLSSILQAIVDIGYLAHPFDPQRQENIQKKEKAQALRRLAIAGIGMMQVMMVSAALYIGEYNAMSADITHFLRWISMIMATPVVLYAGQGFFSNALSSLKRWQFGMDVPVSLAIGIAYSASIIATLTHSGHIYFDSVTMFVFFLLGSRYLEMMTRHKNSLAVESNIRLLPTKAVRIIEQKEDLILASELEIGDKIVVKPGEVIPADGTIYQGQTTINESLLTGESAPQLKSVGDPVIAGSLNIDNPVFLTIDKVGQETVLNQILRLVERAQNEKPKLTSLVDHIASYFILAVLLFTIIISIFWYFYDPSKVLFIALAVLVVTCPCALSLATPTALTNAIQRLAAQGILIIKGHALETLAKVTDIVFDKTGTLTTGKLHLEEIILLDNNYSKEQCLQYASSLEQYSLHPIAQGFKSAYTGEILTVAQQNHYVGQGLDGIIQGAYYRIGSLNFIGADTISANESKVIAVLANQEKPIAAFYFKDSLRPQVLATVQQFQSLGIKVHLLSGDKTVIVESLAKELAINHALGEQLPEDKLAYIETLQDKGAIVAMVGDGINDAPVLSKAQISFAMGSGSELAQASADIIVLSEKLDTLYQSIWLAKRTKNIIQQNILWAIGYNILALPLAASGYLAPWMAAIGMSASSLLVVLNALRLR